MYSCLCVCLLTLATSHPLHLSFHRTIHVSINHLTQPHPMPHHKQVIFKISTYWSVTLILANQRQLRRTYERADVTLPKVRSINVLCALGVCIRNSSVRSLSLYESVMSSSICSCVIMHSLAYMFIFVSVDVCMMCKFAPCVLCKTV